jgi:hypothetical protein
VAFPSDTGTYQTSVSDGWKLARALASRVKAGAISLKAKSLAGTMTSTDVLEYVRQNYDTWIALGTLASISGMAEYAKAQVADPTIDIPGDFTAMRNAMVGVTNWVLANFPKTPTTNELRAYTFNPDNSGRLVDVIFNVPANTAPLRTALDTLIASIN